MYLLVLGLVLMALKFLAWGPVAQWSWWLVLTPLALTVVWWALADATGYTKRKAMQEEDKRLEQRRARTKKALDGNFPKPRR